MQTYDLFLLGSCGNIGFVKSKTDIPLKSDLRCLWSEKCLLYIVIPFFLFFFFFLFGLGVVMEVWKVVGAFLSCNLIALFLSI